MIDLKWGERNGEWAARGLMNGFDVIVRFTADDEAGAGRVKVSVRAFRESIALGYATVTAVDVQGDRIEASPYVLEVIDGLARDATMQALQKLATLVQSAKNMGIE
jgi:hypothetical protein